MSQRSRVSYGLPKGVRGIPARKHTSSSSSCSSGSGADSVATLAAQRVSDAIDEDLKKESARRQAERLREVKVILLGQAESGKSTLHKQFQLYHASHTLDAERPAWRIVVYANLIRAVRTILDELEYEFSLAREEYPWPPSPTSTSNDASVSGSEARAGAFSASGSTLSDPIDVTMGVQSQNECLALRRALLPLIALEGSLASELSDGIAFVGARPGRESLFSPRASFSSGTREATSPLVSLSEAPGAVRAVARVAQALGSMANLIEALWRHRAVDYLVRTRKIRLEESGSFFMNEVQRIAQPDYLPSTADVLHVRLQTVGVIEHSIQVKTVGGNFCWRIYDVAGIRSQRPVWCSYFDDVNALIFLVPISAFDQYLEEDPHTNRISDSLQLLMSVCANPLLKTAQMILLLNKTDVLRRKLEAGIQIRQYITSYGARPNNFATAIEYFRTHFLAARKKKDPFKRMLYIHFTSMLDVQATQVIIASVEDLIMRRHIAQTRLM